MGIGNKFFDFIDEHWVTVVGVTIIIGLLCIKTEMAVMNGEVV
jgi:hypothetical protein